MAERGAGALVIGFRREDERRFARVVKPSAVRTAFGQAVLLGTRPQVITLPPELQANMNGGPCISCGHDVYLNRLGWSALVERDADVCCMGCEDRYSAEITRAL